jgi:lysylphosphatidylglycerol synthetase-like protein (DUF2156 family)
MNPVFSSVISLLGAGNTFLLGAVILIAGAALLWFAQPRSLLGMASTTIETAQILSLPTRLKKARTKIFSLGLIAGLLVNVLLRVSPQFLHQTIPTVAPEYLAAAMLLIAAVLALPLERYIKAWSFDQAMGLGLISILAVIGASGIFHHPLLAVITVGSGGFALGLLFIAQIPWCLGMLPPPKAGLATGLYFGGMGAATALLSLLLIIT